MIIDYRGSDIDDGYTNDIGYKARWRSREKELTFIMFITKAGIFFILFCIIHMAVTVINQIII